MGLMGGSAKRLRGRSSIGISSKPFAGHSHSATLDLEAETAIHKHAKACTVSLKAMRALVEFRWSWPMLLTFSPHFEGLCLDESEVSARAEPD